MPLPHLVRDRAERRAHGRVPLLMRRYACVRAAKHLVGFIVSPQPYGSFLKGGPGPLGVGPMELVGKTFFAKKVFPNPFPKTPKRLT
jgi:hypothetical protein